MRRQTGEHSSAGRAHALQAWGHRFEPCCSHHFDPPYPPGLPGAVVQLVRTPACHAGGRGFKSLPRRHPFFVLTVWSSRRRGRGKDTFASVAQLVEQRTENPRVVGSIPTGGTIPAGIPCGDLNASVAHLVERHLAKVEVASSSLVTRSKTGQSFLCPVFLKIERCHSQVVRQSSAKAPLPSSNLGGTSSLC